MSHQRRRPLGCVDNSHPMVAGTAAYRLGIWVSSCAADPPSQRGAPRGRRVRRPAGGAAGTLSRRWEESPQKAFETRHAGGAARHWPRQSRRKDFLQQRPSSRADSNAFSPPGSRPPAATAVDLASGNGLALPATTQQVPIGPQRSWSRHRAPGHSVTKSRRVLAPNSKGIPWSVTPVNVTSPW